MSEVGAPRADGWCAVGRVAALYRHPVKSMAAQPISSAMLDRYGLVGDRRFALRKRGDPSGFPWLTASKLPALIGYQVEDAEKRHPAMRLRAPGGEIVSCEGDAITRHFAEVHGVDVELAHLTHGMFDCAGLSIISRQTIASLEALTGVALDPRRFRPNIIIETEPGSEQYPENSWVGCTITFGDAESGPRAAVTELDERCVMINLDPDTSRSSPEILRAVVQLRDNRAGIYAVPTRGGAIAVGDIAYTRRP